MYFLILNFSFDSGLTGFCFCLVMVKFSRFLNIYSPIYTS